MISGKLYKLTNSVMYKVTEFGPEFNRIKYLKKNDIVIFLKTGGNSGYMLTNYIMCHFLLKNKVIAVNIHKSEFPNDEKPILVLLK